MQPEAVPANKIAAGVTLLTKNGRNIGNAIIVARMGDVWLIETDFGNKVHFSVREINDWFELGFISDVDKWREDRRTLLAQG